MRGARPDLCWCRVRPRGALLALPALLLLLAVAAGGRPRVERFDHAGDGPAISAVVQNQAHAELPALDGAPLAPPVVTLPTPRFVELAARDRLPCATSACGSSFVLADRPLLL